MFKAGAVLEAISTVTKKLKKSLCSNLEEVRCSFRQCKLWYHSILRLAIIS